MNALQRIYSDHKIIGIEQMLVDGVGWYDTLIDQESDVMAVAMAGKDSEGRKIRMMAVRIEGPDGFQRVADFRPEELV